MSTPKVSIIVPVYNAEKYINHCVDGILAQTFTDWELLLVDDGSPDKSGEICDDYAKLDKRIRVFHKENGGVSSARQTGIEKAIGEYSIHVDPDDWVEPDMLEELYRKAKNDNADMVICDFIYEYKSRSVICKQHIDECNAETILKQMFSQELHGSCCNKLIRLECYHKYSIRFPKDIIRWEDLYVVCSLLMHSIKCAYVPKAFYHYDLIINDNSIVRKTTMQGLVSQIRFVEHFKLLGYSTNWLYESMCATKELAYSSRLLDDRKIISLFSEINERYQKKKRGFLDFIPKGLAALLQGKHLKSSFYRFLYSLWILKKKYI